MQQDLLQIGFPDLVFIPLFLLGLLSIFTSLARRLVPGYAAELVRLAWLRMVCVIPVFIFMVHAEAADCQSYWRWPAQGEIFTYGQILGSDMVELLMYPLAWWLKLSFFSCFLPFAALGSVGALLLSATVIQLRQGVMSRMTWFLLVIPNAIFWSSAPGKDVMMWFFAALLLYSLFCLRGGFRTVCSILFAIAGMFAFRPHVAIASIIALIPVLFFAPVGKIWLSSHRGNVLLFVVIAFGAILPFAKDYLHIEDFTDVSTYALRIEASGDLFRADNEGEGSSIDLSGASPPLRMVTFMFRPLFFDATNTAGFIASVENFILLMLTVLLIFKRRFWQGLLMRDMTVSVPLYLWLSSWVMLSMAGGNNLGLFARQKVQLMPFWILLICVLSVRRRPSQVV